MSNPSYITFKRLLDAVFSAAALIGLLPIFIAIAILVKVTSRGPVIFKQTRVGFKGRHFSVYKFRTMIAQAERMGSSVTTQGDARITTFGHFLRATKLDELPQLWNVLVGDMSWVGPRPDVPGFADRLEGPDRIILSVRPGLTGPATLKYRNEEAILARQPDPERFNAEVIYPDKVRLNREYVERQSFGSDLKYILMTLGLRR